MAANEQLAMLVQPDRVHRAVYADPAIVERFVCPYHGWSYDRAGTLKAAPFSSGYAPGKLAELRLHAAPRVAVYRGFIFASFAPRGESLEGFLGPAKAS